MRLFIVAPAAFLGLALPALGFAQASQPAAAKPTTLEQLQSRWTLVYELDQEKFRVQEMWSITVPAGTYLPKDALRLHLPDDARKANLDEEAAFELTADGQGVVPLDRLEGTVSVNLSYLLDVPGSERPLSHQLGAPVGSARVIFQRFAEMKAVGMGELQVRNRDFEGVGFLVYDFGRLAPGHRLTGTITGIPIESHLGRQVALVLALGAAAWLIIGLGDRSRTARPVMGVMSATARRDQILAALELLESERGDADGPDKRYTKRREALLKDLSAVLEEIELASGPARKEATEPA